MQLDVMLLFKNAGGVFICDKNGTSRTFALGMLGGKWKLHDSGWSNHAFTHTSAPKYSVRSKKKKKKDAKSTLLLTQQAGKSISEKQARITTRRLSAPEIFVGWNFWELCVWVPKLLHSPCLQVTLSRWLHKSGPDWNLSWNADQTQSSRKWSCESQLIRNVFHILVLSCGPQWEVLHLCHIDLCIWGLKGISIS